MIFTPLPFESDLKPGGPAYPEVRVAAYLKRGEETPCVLRAERMGRARFVVTRRSSKDRWVLVDWKHALVFWKEPPHAQKLRRIHYYESMRRWRWDWAQIFEATPAPGEAPLPPGAPRLLAIDDEHGTAAWLGQDFKLAHHRHAGWRQGDLARPADLASLLPQLWADEESSLRQSWLTCQMSHDQYEAYHEARARAARGPGLLAQAAIGLRRLLGIRP